MKGLIATIRKLGVVRVAILGALTIGVVGGFMMLGMKGAPVPRMALLASDLDAQAVQQVSDALDKAKLTYRTDPGSGQIYVADSDMAAARDAMKATGVSAGGPNTPGYEIFDQGSDLMMTDFEQQVKLTRALEGELSRTIMSVRGIRRARVHIVLPKRQPFERQKTEAQASVMLTLAGQGTLSSEAIQSIVNLVAAGVPGLRARNITVVDSNLHLLVRAGGDDDERLLTERGEEIRQKTETRLAQAVELMLERSLGVGHVHAEASIRMNFDKVNETQERFDPDATAVRSTQAVTTNNKTTDKVTGVSVQNNLPNADAGTNYTGSQEAKQEETTNYEITKTVRAIAHDQPQVERVSLAVMVDGVDEASPDGKHVWRPRNDAELAQIEKLVKSAIGFDESRGDRVDIVSMPFTNAVEAPDVAPAAAPASAHNNELIRFAEMVAFGIIGLTVIIMTGRSIYMNLAKPPVALAVTEAPVGVLGSAQPYAVASNGNGSAALGAARAAALTQGGTAPIGLSGANTALQFLEAPAQPSLRQKVEELIEQDPERAAAVIREWLAEE